VKSKKSPKKSNPSRRGELAARKAVHDSLREIPTAIDDLRVLIERAATKHALPACPYDRLLCAVSEYYNSLADQFDDPPDEHPLQSFEAAHTAVRKLAKAAAPPDRQPCANPNGCKNFAHEGSNYCSGCEFPHDSDTSEDR
jgi:hypothetical protein